MVWSLGCRGRTFFVDNFIDNIEDVFKKDEMKIQFMKFEKIAADYVKEKNAVLKEYANKVNVKKIGRNSFHVLVDLIEDFQMWLKELKFIFN